MQHPIFMKSLALFHTLLTLGTNGITVRYVNSPNIQWGFFFTGIWRTHIAFLSRDGKLHFKMIYLIY